MQVDLDGLLDLQEKDKAVRAAEERLGALEPEIMALDAELAGMREQLELARKAAEEADSRREELEGRIESYRVMQERRREKLEWVRGAKEASTIMAELDLARGVLAKEEAEWLRSADRVQQAEERVAEAETLVQALRDKQVPAREELAAKGAQYKGELEVAGATRDEAAKQIEANLLGLYRRILRGRAPMALYPLRGGACGHCFTAVPLHRRQQIENSKMVEACEVCGVLVYSDTGR